MFAPHEATRRAFVRVAFVLLAILPTAALAGWAAMRHLPGYTDAVAQVVAEHTGLAVSLEAVDHPRPGEMRLVQLELRDPETGMLIARAERVTLSTADDLVTIDLAGAKLEPGGLADAWRALDLRLRRHAGDLPTQHIRLTATELTTHAAADPLVLYDVQSDVDCRAVGTEVRLTFGTNEEASDKKVQLRVVRNRQTSPPTSGFELNAEGAPLPCALAEPLWSAAPWFGPKAHFLGHVWAIEATDATWRTTIRGKFTDVDLRHAVEAHFPQKLRGNGEVVLVEAQLDGERLVLASGTISAGPGQISRDLVDSAWRSFHLRGADWRFESLPELTRFDSLACSFHVDASGIALARHPAAQAILEDGKPAGHALLVDSESTLLAIPSDHPRQPITALVRALVPPTADKLPADDRAAWLLQALPTSRP